MAKLKTIKSPKGVSDLVRALWLSYPSGKNRPEDNVYMVELPPLTEEDQEEARRNRQRSRRRS